MRTGRLPGLLTLLGAALVGLALAAFLPVEMTKTIIDPLRLQTAARSLSRAFGVQKHLTSPASILKSSTTSHSTATHQRHNFSSTTAANMDMALHEAIRHRRTIYQLESKSPIPDSRIQEILESAVKHVPSSFNSQSTRLVALLKDDHIKFWETVMDILKAIVPEDSWEKTAQRLTGFKNGYGTVLFYEDPTAVKKLQETYPAYADKFPSWSEHTSAMHQYALWTAFETEGLGCNLQHYNPLPDAKVAEIWKVPLEWSLKAQLVFGTPAEGAREKLPEKKQQPLSERLFVHGAS